MEQMWKDLREIADKLLPEESESQFYLIIMALIDLDNRLQVFEGRKDPRQ